MAFLIYLQYPNMEGEKEIFKEIRNTGFFNLGPERVKVQPYSMPASFLKLNI